jgi:hypothetical protein
MLKLSGAGKARQERKMKPHKILSVCVIISLLGFFQNHIFQNRPGFSCSKKKTDASR